jgi:uncharacterized protein (DUF1697 family)
MARHIALLRGINLGPARRVAMADLRGLCEDLGYEDVRTYVQSGNVVLTSNASPGEIERELALEIATRLGVETDVIVRTREDLAGVIERDPFGDLVDEPKRYQVSFLSGEPDPALTRELEQLDVAPERVVVSGREVYAWHPDGIQRSKLARALSDRRLGVTATARNWNTVRKLLEMADEQR